MKLEELLTKLQLRALRIDDAKEELDAIMKTVALEIQRQQGPQAAGTRSR